MPQPSRHVLVCVSGMSPAIITETLFALVTQHDFVPDEVHVITTLEGRDKIERQLFQPDSGAFHALVADYLPGRAIRFDASTLHVIGTEVDLALTDIQTDQDNRHAANTIYRVLREIKDQPGTRLHATVAGGRKSMSFYMGHAFSLVAEAGDQLSHVLVNAPFETLPDFFYPPREPRLLQYKVHGSQEHRCISTAEARVQLALLSVLRLGAQMHDLPKRARTDFDFAVQLAQASLEPPQVRLVWRKADEAGVVELLGETVELSASLFKMLALYALARQNEADLYSGALLLAKEVWPLLQELCEVEDGKDGDQDVDKRLRDMRSKLRERLEQQVGPVADWLVPKTQGRKAVKQTRPSALTIPADRLTLVNFPPEWWHLLRQELG